MTTLIQRLRDLNEATWLHIGSLAQSMNDTDRAMGAYDSALRHNPYSVPALTQIAALCRAREQYRQAVEYFQRIVSIDPANGEIWGALGHCCLMVDDLQKAYHAYQQALYHLQNPKEPKLWYGIGILYDRYGSSEHAEEAFSAVIRMEPKFDKANEIYFRLGIIYKQQGKFDLSLQCFKYILSLPPKPLTEIDIWFQIGHVYEQQKEYHQAREAYERVLSENPSHSKVLQQLGWLYHQQNSTFSNQELAISYLKRSLDADSSDAQTWYILGRCYMQQQKYPKAYEAYQQAVTKDGKNPIFWCSIGVLYYQISQYRDALDAYSRAIYLNPNISEVWYDLGTLYESCNNQISDAIDAYTRAIELDPYNTAVKERLRLLRNQQVTGQAPPPANQSYQLTPQDPTTYSSLGSNGSLYSGPMPSAHIFSGPQPPSSIPGSGVYSRTPTHDIRSIGRPPEGQGDRKDLPALYPISQSGPTSYSQPPISNSGVSGSNHQSPRPSSGGVHKNIGMGSPKLGSDGPLRPLNRGISTHRRLSPVPDVSSAASNGSNSRDEAYDAYQQQPQQYHHVSLPSMHQGQPPTLPRPPYHSQSPRPQSEGLWQRGGDSPGPMRQQPLLPRSGELMDVDAGTLLPGASSKKKGGDNGDQPQATAKDARSQKSKGSRKSAGGGKQNKKAPGLTSGGTLPNASSGTHSAKASKKKAVAIEVGPPPATVTAWPPPPPTIDPSTAGANLSIRAPISIRDVNENYDTEDGPHKRDDDEEEEIVEEGMAG